MSRIRFKIFPVALLSFVIPSTLLSQSTLDKWKSKAKQTVQQVENTAQPSTPAPASAAGTATTSATPAVASQPASSPAPNTTPVAAPAPTTAASPQTIDNTSWATHPVMKNGASGTAPYMAGDYTANFVCPVTGRTNFKLSLVAESGWVLTGMISFDAQGDSGSQPVTFSLKGNPISTRDVFQLAAVKWETAAPPRRMVMTTAGAYNVNSLFALLHAQFNGLSRISGDGGPMPHCTFTADRIGNPPLQAPPPSAADTAQTIQFCFSNRENPTIYVGDEFSLPPIHRRTTYTRISNTFLKYIQEKYAYAGPGGVSCALKKDDFSKAIFEAERKKAGKKIVETGWKYDGPVE